MRVVTYSRVSTSHHEQNPEVQRDEMRRYCESRSWLITEEIVDHGFSGGTDQRPGLKRLMTLARARKVDVVVVTKLCRLFRSLKHLVMVLDEFEALGVQFISLGDQIDLTTASGRLMMQIVGAFSEFQRSLIRENTMQGLEHARRQGRRGGRPKTRDDDAIIELRSRGYSFSQIQKELGISKGAVCRAIKATPKTPVSPQTGSRQ